MELAEVYPTGTRFTPIGSDGDVLKVLVETSHDYGSDRYDRGDYDHDRDRDARAYVRVYSRQGARARAGELDCYYARCPWPGLSASSRQPPYMIKGSLQWAGPWAHNALVFLLRAIA